METHDQVASKDDIENLQKQITRLNEMFGEVRRYAPPIAAQQARRLRLAYEITGVTIAATGAWWIYPPAALLLVGGWLLGDVLTARRARKRSD